MLSRHGAGPGPGGTGGAAPGLREVVLNPGDFCFAGAGTRIRTLLGSCVSIVLWHPSRRVGGMCHYMLPGRSRRRDAEDLRVEDPQVEDLEAEDLDGRYADEAIQLFLREIHRHGTRPGEYQAKILGGGNQFPQATTPASLDVSRDNVDVGLRLLGQHGFVLTGRHFGGTGFRRVAIDLSTGVVQVVHVDRADVGSRS